MLKWMFYLLTFAVFNTSAAPKAELTQQAKTKVASFAKALKGELSQAIQQGGLSEGIKVCLTRAPEIAKSLSTEGWQVGRTSNKLRNRNSVADGWEQLVMADFSARLAKGEVVDSMTATQVDEAQTQFRFAKAIPVGPLCLNCHGESLAPEVQSALQTFYPGDQAIGYRLGELRGIFSLTKDLRVIH